MKSCLNHKNFFVVLMCAAELCLAAGLANGKTIAVRADGTGDYPMIQEAINDANDGDEVVLEPGTYTGDGNRDIDFKGKAITVQSTDPNDPNIVDITVIDCNGKRTDPHRGFYLHKREDANSIIAGLTIVNGYTKYDGGAICCIYAHPTFTNCTISNNSARWGGGGIYYESSWHITGNLTIANCTIIGNSAELDGGGIYCLNSNPIISDSTINNNTADSGGGIYCHEGSNPTITNVVISGNSAEYEGGGICCLLGGSSPTISNSIINNNTTEGGGGGICCYSSSNLTINKCLIADNHGSGIYCESECSLIIANSTIMGNKADFGAGGVSCGYDVQLTLTNCIVTGNSAEGKRTRAGGIYWDGGGHSVRAYIDNCTISYNKGRSGGIYCADGIPQITNCVISGNWAEYDGGAIRFVTNDPTISNCTITGNSAINEGGGTYFDHSHPILTNCIFWNNSPQQIEGTAPFRYDVSYSDVQGGYLGQGNINAEPHFVEQGYWANAKDPNIITEPNDPNAIWVDGDYHLLPSSPCIDAGDANYIAEPNETDFDGNPRVHGDAIDMGAYEYRPSTPVELAAELLEEVGGLELCKGIENGLEGKLNAALRALEDENEKNDVAAINTLGAFINAVEAQRGKKIPEAEADALIAAAMEIIELLSDG